VSTGAQNSFEHWHNYNKKLELRDDFSKQVRSHSFKVGADYTALPEFGGQLALGSPGAITFFDDPSVIVNNTNGRYPQGFQTPGIVRSIAVTSGTIVPYDSLHSWSFGTYLQDDYKMTPRLTFNLGLRYDVYQFMNQPQLDQNRTYQVLQAIGSPYGTRPQTDKNNFSPRLGLAWDIRGDGKDVIRGGFGVFYDQGLITTFFYPNLQSKPFAYFTQTYTNATIGSGPLANFVYGVSPLPTAPAAPTSLPAGQGTTGYWYQPDFKDALSEQSHVGYSHLFPHETVLSVDYTHILGLNGWRFLNVNPLLDDDNNAATARVRPLAAATASAFGDPNLFGAVNLASSVNRSLYDEVAIHFERRFSANAAFQVNYALAWARGMGGTTDRTTQSGAIAPQTPSATGGDIYAPWEWGPASFDERHRITIAGVFHFPFDIDLSPSFTAASARPYTQYRATNPSGDGSLMLLGADGNPVGVNNALGKALINASARATKNVELPSGRKLALFAEFYNVLNRANFGNSYGGNQFSPTTYNQPTGYLGGIGSTSTIPISFQVQFGARFTL
jgi:hypothetical protein